MRKTLLLAILTAAALAASLPALAQEGQMDEQAMQEMMMKLAVPGAPHQHLAEAAGKWTSTMTMFMPGAEPMNMTGTYEAEMVLGGRYLVGHYHSSFMGQPFEGMSVDGYDNAKQEFFSMWFDSMGTGYFITKGQASADGKTYEYKGTMDMGPMQMPARTVTTYPDKDTMHFVMYQTMGGQESKSMEVTYKRVK